MALRVADHLLTHGRRHAFACNQVVGPHTLTVHELCFNGVTVLTIASTSHAKMNGGVADCPNQVCLKGLRLHPWGQRFTLPRAGCSKHRTARLSQMSKL